MRKILICILVSLIFLNISAQIRITVSGFVKDSLSNEALIGAYIIDPAANIITSTNNYGFFSIKIPDASVSLVITYVGYSSKKLTVNNSDTVINIKLKPDNIIEEVVVKASGDYRILSSQTSLEKISAKTVNNLPVIMGESDITRTIQLLPGVVMGSESTSGYFVRGGNSDQNLILIDGTPIYNAYHMYGLFSVFNSDAINDAKFYKGGIPAQYGGRLSSVLDLSMREGNAHKYSGEIMLGTFSSKFLVEGPIYNEKTSFLVTGRRSILDISPEFIKNMTLFLSGIYKEQGYMERVDLYSFYDINTKINHSFSDRSRLYFSFYKGNDEYPTNKMMSDTYFNFGNTTFSVRWNYLFSNNLYSNITLYYSKFNYINTRGTLQKDSTGKAISGYSLRNTSGIEDYSGKVDFDYALLNHDLKFGAQYVKQNLDPGVYSYNSAGSNPQFNSDTTYNYNKEAHQGVLYVSDNFKPLDKLTINAGLRFDAYFVDNIVHASLQPRFSCNYQLINNLSIKASYTRVTQQLHLLSATSSGAPSDIWVPSTKKVAPSNSNEFVLGINYNFKNIVTLTVEGFTKYMNNLIMYKEGASYAIDKTDWQNMIETGKGKSQGIEFGLKKEKGNTTGWISYTLSRTTRQFDNINFGNEFPFTYDRTHNIAIALMQKLGKKFEIGADWLYATGNAITLSNTMYYNIVPLPPDEIYQSINHYESINGERMPTFHRLDVCINYNKTGKILSYKISLGAYNIYARQNPYYIIESPEGIKMESLFKVLPYLSLSLKF